MKMKILGTLLSSVCLVLVITTTNVNAQNTLACKPIDKSLELNEKYGIDLESGFIKNANEGMTQKINFAYHFRRSDTVKYLIKESIDSICMSALINDFYEGLLLPEIQNNEKCKDRSCIAGFRIQYGFRNERIVNLYQPVYLSKKDCSSNSCTFSLHFVNKQDFYSFDSRSARFVKITDGQQLKADTAAYHQQLRVKRHYGGRKFKSLNLKGSWLGDSKAIIFSFQEILEIYNRSYPNEVDGNRYMNKIEIHNGAAFYVGMNWITNLFTRSRIKHTSFISPGGWSTNKSYNKVLLHGVMTGGGNNVANLGHLCPPSCQDITYPILN
jgi:hypothetical protein